MTSAAPSRGAQVLGWTVLAAAVATAVMLSAVTSTRQDDVPYTAGLPSLHLAAASPSPGTGVLPAGVVSAVLSDATSLRVPMPAVAVQGSTLVVGEPAAVDSFGHPSGRVMTYALDRAGHWAARQELRAPADATASAFGRAVAVSGDEMAAGSVGGVFTFARSAPGSPWYPTGHLTAPDGATRDLGAALMLDGHTLAVGDPAAGDDDGAVQVYTWSAGAWSRVATVTGPAGRAPSMFGAMLAGTATSLAVGAFNSGTVDVFDRSPVDGSWILRQSLGEKGSMAGSALAYDGVTVAASSTVDGGAGAVQLWSRVGTGWRRSGRLEAPAGADLSGEVFGSALGVAGDTLVVGDRSGPVRDGAGELTGSVSVYERKAGTWTLSSVVKADGVNQSDLGEAVGVDGALVVAAATRPGPEATVDDGGQHVRTTHVLVDVLATP